MLRQLALLACLLQAEGLVALHVPARSTARHPACAMAGTNARRLRKPKLRRPSIPTAGTGGTKPTVAVKIAPSSLSDAYYACLGEANNELEAEQCHLPPAFVDSDPVAHSFVEHQLATRRVVDRSWVAECIDQAATRAQAEQCKLSYTHALLDEAEGWGM